MKKSVVYLSLVLALIAGWKVIVFPGYVYLAEQFEVYDIRHFLNVAYPAWNENLQAPNTVDIAKLYLYILATILSFGSYKLLQVILLLTPIFIAFLSMFKFAHSVSKKEPIAYIAAFIYTINPWFATEPRNTILRFEYALTPFLLYLALRTIKENQKKDAILFAIIFSIVSGFRYTFLVTMWLIIILLVYLFIDEKILQKGNLIKGSFLFFVSGIIAVVISIARFLPQFIYASKVSNVFAEAFTSSSVRRLPYFDVFTTQTLAGPALKFNMTYKIPTYYLFIIVVAFSLLGIKLEKTKKSAAYLISLTLLVFSIPFCVTHGITFAGIPTLGRLLRHAKWNTIPIVIAVSILSGYAIEKFERKKLVALFVIGITGISSYPLLTGDLNGYWMPSEVPKDYVIVNKIIANKETTVLWMPTFSPRKATWVNASTPYDVGAPTGGFDIRSSSAPSFLYPLYYFFLYYTPIYDFRFSPIRNFDDYQLLAKLYSMIGIKYIALHNDVAWIGKDKIRGLSNEYVEEIGKELSNSGYTQIYTGKLVKLYEVPYPTYKFSTADLGIDIGGDRLMDIGTILSISNTTGIVFKSFRNGINPDEASFFIVKESPLIDLIDWDIIIRPFSFTVNDRPEEGWIRTSVTSYDFLYYLWRYNITWNWYFDYSSGVAFTIKGAELGKIHPGEGERLSLRFSPNSMFLDVNNYEDYVNGHIQAGVDNTWAEAISDPIRVNDLSYYMITMSISGVSVIDLNAIIYYYDQNNNFLGFDVLNEPFNGTFASHKISNIIYTPEKTAYIRIGIRSWRNPSSDSDWIVKDITLYDLSESTRYNTLKMRFDVKENGVYTAFARVFYNQKGGKLAFTIDGDNKSLYTKDDLNAFKWVKLGEFYLTEGTHTIELKNIKGFNAVNLIIFIKDYKEKITKAKELLKNKDIIYIYKAERDFYLKDGVKTKEGVQVTYISNEFIKPLYLPKPSNSWVFAPSILDPIPVCPENACTLKVSYTRGSPNDSEIKIQTQNNSTRVQYTFKSINSTPVVVNWNLNHENWSAYDAITIDVFGDGSENVLELWYYNNHTRKHVRIGGIELDWTGWKTITFIFPDYERDDVVHFKVVLSWGRKEKGLGDHEIILGKIELKRLNGFKMWRNFEIFKEGLYDVAVRGKSGTFKVYVDQKDCTLTFGEEMQWKTCTFHLTPGQHTIRIVSPKKGSRVDAILTYTNGKSLDELFDKKANAHIIYYERVSATKWRVKVRAEDPFVLVFTNGYDPLWVAKVDGKEYRSMPLYGVINGFYITKRGEYWITVEYKLQYYQNIGMMISIIAFIATMLFLWRKA